MSGSRGGQGSAGRFMVLGWHGHGLRRVVRALLLVVGFRLVVSLGLVVGFRLVVGLSLVMRLGLVARRTVPRGTEVRKAGLIWQSVALGQIALLVVNQCISLVAEGRRGCNPAGQGDGEDGGRLHLHKRLLVSPPEGDCTAWNEGGPDGRWVSLLDNWKRARG